MGRVPKMMQVLADSPAAAEAYLNMNLSLSHAMLPPATRTLIAAAPRFALKLLEPRARISTAEVPLLRSPGPY